MMERLQAALLGLLLNTDGYHVRFFKELMLLLSRWILTTAVISEGETGALYWQQVGLGLFLIIHLIHLFEFRRHTVHIYPSMRAQRGTVPPIRLYDAESLRSFRTRITRSSGENTRGREPQLQQENRNTQKQAPSHLGVDAGPVRVLDAAQDLLRHAAAPLHDLLRLRIGNKCAALRQRCAAGEHGHVAGDGEECCGRKSKRVMRRTIQNVSIGTDPLFCTSSSVLACQRRAEAEQSVVLSSPPPPSLSSSSALQQWACLSPLQAEELPDF